MHRGGQPGLEEPQPDETEYTEFGIKIHKLRLTLKVHKRRSASTSSEPTTENTLDATADASDTDTGYPRMRLRSASQGRRRRARTGSTASGSASLADSLRLLDLDPKAGSRRPVITATTSETNSSTRLANWEFQGFYAPARTSTPSSGYSSAAVSRTSSFSSSAAASRSSRSSRLPSAEDSVYSEVYTTIEETSELADPFDDEEYPPQLTSSPRQSRSRTATLTASTKKKTASSSSLHQSQHHSRTASAVSTSTLQACSPREMTQSMSSLAGAGEATSPARHCSWGSPPKSTSGSLAQLLPPDIAPPLPPRSSKCRPPARPPYSSSIVLAVQRIAEPLNF